MNWSEKIKPIINNFISGFLLPFCLVFVAGYIFLYLSQQNSREEFFLRENRLKKRLQTSVKPLFSSPTSQLVNSQARLNALKIIFAASLSELKDLLTRENLSDFRDFQLPLPEFTSLILANRGRTVMELGMDSSPFLPPDWQTPFFFGLLHGSPILEKRVGYFYPRPVSADVFNSFAGELQIMKNKLGIFAWTFMSHDNRALLLLINIEKISNEKLAELLQNHFTSLYKDIKLPSFPWKKLLIFSLLSGLFGAFSNWPELARKFFGFRLGLLMSIVFLIIEFAAFNFFTALSETRKKLLTEKEKEQIISILKNWEQDFEPATSRFAEKLLNTVRSNNELKDHIWPEQINITRASIQGFIQTHPEEMEPAIETFFAFVIPNALLNHPRCPTIEKKELLSRFESPRFAEIRKHLFEKKTNITEFRSLLLDSARFVPVRMGQKEFLWLFSIPDNEDKMLNNFAFVYPREAFAENHIREMSTKKLTEIPDMGIIVKSSKLHRDLILGNTKLLKKHTDITDWAFDNEEIATIVQDEDKGFSVALSLQSALYDSRFFFLIPSEVLTNNLHEINQHRNICLLLILMFSPVAWFFLTRRLLSPVHKLEQGFDAITHDELSFRLPEYGHDESNMLLQSFNNMSASLEEKRRLSPFVALQLLRLFLRKDGGLEKLIECQATVVFCDIRSFTTISENYQPEEIVGMLNDYFTIWQKAVEKHGGIIEKFIGDAVVCIFPETLLKSHAKAALRTASSVMQSLELFNERRRKLLLFTIKNGIGISSGKISTGIIGNETKKHFFADGHAVRFSEELEAESKNARFSKILVDENVMESCRDMATFQKHESAKPEFANVYELAEFIKET